MRQFCQSFYLTTVTGLVGLFFAQHAGAQVYQCIDAGGKKVFSQTPCAAQGGSGEKLLLRAPAMPTAAEAPTSGTPVKGEPGVLYGNGGATTGSKNWAAENAAANARAQAADRANAAARSSRQAMPSPSGGLRKSTPASAGSSNQQIIANCEANHGARCSSAGEIAQRRMEQRELSASERQQQQSAVAARRQREADEAFHRAIRR
ncbi:DUF4124 domain-containing protein [Polaromonas sp. A23]|uniref:DUF4124 domain-containing protein n=1 Tax=Polaromonas sp. A23 TaxID=1944133 RepID=UPI0009860C59|nr:DUF4124 domain-containing protein [Polaromonas sp. A23]OOG35901.1 hypothetical protein B0B52_21580 [Polaromonas sp. A23]